ncbi:LPS-assembly protein LptD [Flaviflagellibacter deserti]|uniref:LPS-assembly protein LptD n=1 Tax=Flaviflagellibacter deserti TaxID=2267266 RepID=A0ABV9YZW6_9HYPH
MGPSSKNRLAARLGAAAATALLCLVFGPFSQAWAQTPGGLRDPNQQMHVNADELLYDDTKQTVSAVGNVRLDYGTSTVEADRVVYNQATAKVYAYGNVRLTEASGNVIHAQELELSEDLSAGFVNSLLIEGVDKTRFAATRAVRQGGNVTVLDNGVYTACEPCRDNPNKPPLWQIKAARIIHDQNNKTIYYEDARLEFFGMPIAYLPYFQHADSTVKRKTGFLTPSLMSSTEYGVGVRTPFFWNIAPNMDVTVAPTYLSEQGPLLDVEFRHRVMNGAYSIRAAGVFQQDPDRFGTTEQQEDWRGAVQSKGEFAINQYWSWGWDINVLSDRFVLDDYDLWGTGWSEAVSNIHLTGVGDRNYFDLRAYHFYGLSEDDVQEQLPIVGVWDYNYVHDKPVLGGEVRIDANITNLSRDETDFDCSTSECLVRGLGGNYSRASADAQWRKEFVDPIGQVWTPFAYVKGDLAWRDSDPVPSSINGVDVVPDVYRNLVNSDEDFVFRGMAAAGLEYRYPFVATTSWGTHVIEPIAQLILRPDESHIGALPNEDAQSVFFDTTTLFQWDKFSGYDRMEGGGRANIGAQYTFNFNSGGFFNVMFGQSYHLFGTNSFAEQDLVNAGLDSGLDKDKSDYVTGAYLQLTRQLSFSSRFRLDEDDFSPNTAEVEGRFATNNFSGGLIYGRYDEQPRIGFDEAREGVLGNLKVNLNDNVYVGAAARYNLDVDKFDRTAATIGYIDECYAFGLTYSVDFSENGNEDPVQKVFVRFSLRTIGEGGSSFNVGNLASNDETRQP